MQMEISQAQTLSFNSSYILPNPYTKYHYHSSCHLSINFCFLFYAYIIRCHIGNWTLTKMKKMKRKLLPKLLISRTLTFNISVTECPIEINFQFWILQTKAYDISHYKENLNHWLSQPRYLKFVLISTHANALRSKCKFNTTCDMFYSHRKKYLPIVIS